MARVPGLSKYDKPDPLLRMVGNKPRIRRGEMVATTSSDNPKSPDEITRPKFIAPGSDDESVGSTPVKSYRQTRVIPSGGMDDLDSESDDTIRGNIQSTSFSTKRTSSRSTAQKPTSDTTESKSEDRAAALPNRKRKVLHSEGKGPQSSASTESTPPPLSQTPSSSGSHLHDEFGFPKKRNPSKSATTYGKRTTLEKKFGNRKPTHESSVPRFKKSTTGGEQAATSRFKLPPASPIPDATDRSPDKFRRLKHGDPASSQSGPEASNRGKQKLKKEGKRMSKIEEDLKSPESPKPVFKSFSEDAALFDFSGEELELTASALDFPDDLEVQETNPEPTREDSAPAPTLCPWCGEEVSKDLLLGFSKGQRLNVRQQTKFCAKHKKETALDTYKSRQYPSIDWDELPERIDAHREHILGVINGGSSFYRSLLAGKIAAGKDRALKKEGNLNPGYYGPRGFNLMCEQLVVKFSETLKERAVEDRVISGRGTASFVQTVLVAELAVQLIMEDMGVPVEEARDIMEESKSIGEAVHDDP